MFFRRGSGYGPAGFPVFSLSGIAALNAFLLLPEAEALNQRLVTRFVFEAKMIQQRSTSANEFHQPVSRAVILAVDAQMLGQAFYAAG